MGTVGKVRSKVVVVVVARQWNELLAAAGIVARGMLVQQCLCAAEQGLYTKHYGAGVFPLCSLHFFRRYVHVHEHALGVFGICCCLKPVFLWHWKLNAEDGSVSGGVPTLLPGSKLSSPKLPESRAPSSSS